MRYRFPYVGTDLCKLVLSEHSETADIMVYPPAVSRDMRQGLGPSGAELGLSYCTK